MRTSLVSRTPLCHSCMHASIAVRIDRHAMRAVESAILDIIQRAFDCITDTAVGPALFLGVGAAVGESCHDLIISIENVQPTLQLRDNQILAEAAEA